MNSKSSCPAVRQVMFPKDTNPSGNIFGGIILSHIDIAGAVAARQLTPHRVVTVTMDAVLFKRPVVVGDILTCWTEIVKKGRTSIKVKILVEAERQGKIIHVTEGTATYVAVDEQHRSIPWDSPVGTQGESDGDKDAATAPVIAIEPAPSAGATANQECNTCNHGPTADPDDKPAKGKSKKDKERRQEERRRQEKEQKEQEKGQVIPQ
ncbi:MAG: hypothetical protein IPJ49_21340 [Candidatus Obscuribacter sp.]|nr:hypothetical protein [Candidatus Obscuribacter sp.]